MTESIKEKIFSIIIALSFTILFIAERKETLISICLLMTIIAAPIFFKRRKIEIYSSIDRKTLSMIFSLIFLFFMSSLWSETDSAKTIIDSLKLCGSVVFGLSFFSLVQNYKKIDMKKICTGLSIGIIASSLLILAILIKYRIIQKEEWLIKSDINYLLTVITITTPIISIYLWNFKNKKLSILTPTIAIPTLLLSQMIALKLSVIFIFFIFALLYIDRKKTLSFSIFLFFTMTLFTPIAINVLPPPERSINWQWLPESSRHRLFIWDMATKNIFERPFLGWGYNSSRDVFKSMPFPPPSSTSSPLLQTFYKEKPRHPHNFSIQIWMETGLIGIFLFSIFLLRIIKQIAKNKMPPSIQFCVASTFCSLFIISMVSFSFWEHWWQISLWLVASFLYWGIKNFPQDTTP